jgi:hypothetical protein
MGWRAHIGADESGVRAKLVYTTWAVLVELAGWRRHFGARASANPESRDSGFGPAGRPGMTDTKKPAQPMGCAG